MQIDPMAVYFFAVMAVVGIVVLLIFWLSNQFTNQEAKITGIWTNENNSLRILIYMVDSNYQAEIVWARGQEDRLLGLDIIRNMSIKCFRWGSGTYIDPFTKDQFSLKIKLHPGKLQFDLIEKSGHVGKSESWTQIQNLSAVPKLAA